MNERGHFYENCRKLFLHQPTDLRHRVRERGRDEDDKGVHPANDKTTGRIRFPVASRRVARASRGDERSRGVGREALSIDTG